MDYHHHARLTVRGRELLCRAVVEGRLGRRGGSRAQAQPAERDHSRIAFADVCRKLGLRHRRTRPCTPRTNGKAERFIQTALKEWAYARTFQNSDEREKQFAPWIHQYNFHRPHASLGLSPPISRSRSMTTTC